DHVGHRLSAPGRLLPGRAADAPRAPRSAVPRGEVPGTRRRCPRLLRRRMTEAIRIAVLNFVHETVTFLPNDTTLDDFVYDGSPAKGEALLAWEPRSYMGGFVKVAREHPGVELVGIESPLWARTGAGSGWITTEAYEHLLGRMLAELESGGRWHGVYLALHGAMGVRGVARPEADIARRVREVVGRGAFIAGTFDPHGNEDAEFLRQADFAFCGKY